MARKMLRYSLYAGVFHTERVCHGSFSDTRRIFAKRPRTDNRIGRIGIDIGIGSEIGLNAEQAAFACNFLAVVIKQTFVFNGPERYILRETGSSGHTHGYTPLPVNRHKHGYTGLALGKISQRDKLLYIPFGKEQTTDALSLDQTGYSGTRVDALCGYDLAAHQLRYTLTFCQCGIYGIGPTGSFGLAHTFATAADKQTVRRFLCGLSALLILALTALGGGGLAAAALLAMCRYYFVAKRQFGGITGDLAGWFLQRAELWMLAALAVSQWGGVL